MIESFLASLIGVLSYQAIGVVLFLPLELMFPKARIPFKDRADGFIFLIATALVAGVVGAAVGSLRDFLHIRPLITLHGTFGAPVIASIVLALWLDFQFYVVHRLEHRFLWRFHRVHHCIKNLSAANSYHHWTEPIWSVGLLSIPLMFLDVSIGPTLGTLTFTFTYWQFYIHSSSRPHVGPLRWILVDNRYHRIHHSVEPEHHDHNFGALFTLSDWIFGTLKMPKPGECPEVGLRDVPQPTSLKEWSGIPFRGQRERQTRLWSKSRSA